ncbi:hypothetical protein EDB19DRAFT_1345158 [Suillus lakei]|nr:hypothetical protein EDB19DRAFT_1345158 [Suillus lakei]
MLRINYRWSSIVLDKWSNCRLVSDSKLKNLAYTENASEFPVAEDRAPDAPGVVTGPDQVTSLFDLLLKLRPVRHTVLLFTSAGNSECFQYPIFRTALLPRWPVEDTDRLSMPTHRV